MQTHTLHGPIIINLHLSRVAAEAGRTSLVPLVVLRHITGTGALPNSDSAAAWVRKMAVKDGPAFL
ncbi:hypothetical protein VUR80DRAFT_3901 [Thermomyces stellatus]